MNTPAHLIFGMAAFGRVDRRDVTAAALLGSLLPDLSLYLLVGWSLLVQGLSPGTVFGTLYFSALWQRIFAVDNSMPLWGLLLAAGLWRRWPGLVAFGGAGLLHLALDFALHSDDARRHFWPLSDFVFHSPLSYWDPRHFGNLVGPLEVGLSLLICGVLWRRFTNRVMRALIVFLGLAEFVPVLMFAVMFHD